MPNHYYHSHAYKLIPLHIIKGKATVLAPTVSRDGRYAERCSDRSDERATRRNATRTIGKTGGRSVKRAGKADDRSQHGSSASRMHTCPPRPVCHGDRATWACTGRAGELPILSLSAPREGPPATVKKGDGWMG